MNQTFPDIPVIHLDWPQESRLGFPDACVRIGLKNHFEAIQRDMSALAALSKAVAPVVGITGTLKAGKTSTVKKFLSEEGRKRTPSGLGKKLGTQRFVFWLPATWQSNPEVWQAFKEGLEALFGNQLEELSSNPEIATRQYNGYGDVKAHLGIPLFAFDAGLDRYGFALMDSPDMERPVEGVDRERSAEVRIEFVQRALRGLSAVLVLCEASKAEIELLGHLLAGGAHEEIPVFLLLNQIDCRDGELSRILNDEGARELAAKLSASRIHAAYHGRFEGAREVIARVLGSDQFDADLPHFFRVEPASPKGEPPVLLENELAALEPARLWRDKITAKRTALKVGLDACVVELVAKLDQQRSELELARDNVVRFVRDQVVDSDRNELATPLMPSTAAQIASAIIDHCPIYAKPTMFVHGRIMAGFEYLKNLKDGIKSVQDPGDAIRNKAGELRKDMAKRGIPNFNPIQWASRSRNQKFMPDEVPENTLVELWTKVGSKASDLKVELDPQVLRSFAEALWDGVPWWKKISLALVGPVLLIGALAALVMAAVDGGTTSVVFFFSIKELLATLGLTTLATMTALSAAKSLEADLINRAAIPFYTALVKGALDSFGLPRHSIPAVRERFANTGDFTLDLTPVRGETPLQTLVDLSGGRVIGRLQPKACDTVCREILELHTPTQQP